MPSAKYAMPKDWTLADLLAQIGDVPPQRIRMRPMPGTATEKDLLRVLDHENRLCELVDGVLVEKPMATREGAVSAELVRMIGNFAVAADLGFVFGGDTPVRLLAGLVRLPDVFFIGWDQLPSRFLPEQAIADLYPDLAVEVLSESNTRGEMLRKRKDYFTAGCRLVWEVDPRARTVTVYTAPDQPTVLSENDTLDGAPVLPGFTLPVRDVFARLGPPTPTPRKRRKGK